VNEPADVAALRNAGQVQASGEIAPQRESELLKGILDAMVDGVYITRRDCQIEYLNPALERILGPVQGRKCHEYFHDRTEPCDWCHRGQVQAGESVQWEWHSPGTGRWYDVFETPLPYSDGSVSKLTFLHDITAKKEAETAARESERRYCLIADNVTDVIWTLEFAPAAASGDGPQGPLAGARLTYISPSIYRLLGYSQAEAMRLTPKGLLAPASFSAASDALDQQAGSGAFASMTLDLEHVIKDGTTRWCEVTSSFFRDDRGEVAGVLGVTRDITERRKLEQELAEIRTHERQQIGRELHDHVGQQLLGLRLMTASLQKSLQARGVPESEAVAELILALEEAQDRVRQVIKGVRPVDVDADGLMAALAGLCENTEKLAQVRCAFHCDRPVPIEDNRTATELFYVAQEAVINAVKHARAKHIAVGLMADHGRLEIWVRDDGAGQPASGWTEGMGMRIMRYRAAAIGAVLEIQSAGSGTLVTCTLHREVEHGRERAGVG
jgi:PAS domain S-box-containing protein